MDPFTISTGIAGFLSLALEITKILKEYTSEVKSAPTDAHTLLTEVTALYSVLEHLIEFLRAEDIKGNFRETSALCGVINFCEDKIKRLHAKLIKFQRTGGFADRLPWPFHKQDCLDVASTLHHCAQTIHFSLNIANCELLSKTSEEVMAALSDQRNHIDSLLPLFKDIPADMTKMRTTLTEVSNFIAEINQEIRQIKSGVRSIQQNMEDDNIEKLLAWLSPLNPETRHQTVKTTRVPKTGNWVLQSNQFQTWMASETDDQYTSILGCYGKPGAGKTVITSIVVDYISAAIEKQPGTSIIYLYCDYRDQNEQSLLHIIGCFIKQIVLQLVCAEIPVPEAVRDPYKSAQRSKKSLGLDEAITLLKHLLQKLDSTFILIDALDELQQQTRIDFLKVALDILHSRSPNSTNLPKNNVVRFFFTSRHHVQDQINRCLGSDVKILAITAHEDDIQKYILHRIDKDAHHNRDAMNNRLKNEILDLLPKKSEGMFLLAVLHIDVILDKLTVSKRRSALRHLPPGLYSAYDETLTRIQGSQSRQELGMSVLMWAYLAERPLNVIELRHALSVEDGAETLDHENFPSENAILDCCCGLVMVDNETSTIRLVHYTLQEYFKAYHDKYFPTGHTLIAKTCLTYLSFPAQTASIGMDLLRKLNKDYPLLQYAANEWGHHARRQCDEPTCSLAVTLLQRSEHPQVLQHLRCISHPYFSCKLLGLHAAAQFGAESIFYTLLQAADPNCLSSCGNTALMYAAHAGHGAIVRLLLARSGVDVNMQAKNGITPLSRAAKSGHGDVVRLLLEREDIDINIQDQWGSTPLSQAAGNGHEVVAHLLLARPDVDVNMQNSWGKTPLSFAAENGHEATVWLLVQRADVDVNAKDTTGATPLSLAASKGYEAIVRRLLERADIDVNNQDKTGLASLSIAASKGHEAIVRLLLGRAEIVVDIQDKAGSTPLSLAASKGHEAIVCLLLERTDIDVNIQDSMGSTSLSLAASSGHDAVVCMLLRQSDVDANLQDKNYRTPLFRAAENGREAVIRLLLSRSDVDVNMQNLWGMTPLSRAAANGREAIVPLLLARSDIHANMQDDLGRTPLFLAAENGYASVVCLLLQRDDVNLNLQNENGKKPLSIAAEKGHETVVRLLPSRVDVDVNVRTKSGDTPLSIAAKNGHEAVVCSLLARADVDVNMGNKTSSTLLSIAARHGHEAVVRLLLARADVDVDVRNEMGDTPLSIAVKNGHEAVVRLLLSRADVDVNLRHEAGDTLLSIAARNGHEAVVRLVLARPDVNVNVPNKTGDTPLSIAARYGHESVVRLLLAQADVDVNVRNKAGDTPLSIAVINREEAVVRARAGVNDPTALSIAAGKGHEAVVRLLLSRADVDANVRNKAGDTLLSTAVENGHEAVVRLLLARADVDVNVRNEAGDTLLSTAVKNGHEAVVRLLLSRADGMSPSSHFSDWMEVGENLFFPLFS